MKIGKLVPKYAPKIFTYCEQHPGESKNLMDAEYSNRIFGVNFPFCMESKAIEHVANNRRFWAKTYTVCGKTVRVTNNWFANSKPKFVQYLIDKNIINETGATDLLQSINTSNPQHVHKAEQKSSYSNKRYRKPAIGDSQNGFVRSILGNLGNESFSDSDWIEVKKSFGQKCVYCEEAKVLVMDHAVPINRTHLGEHRLGNLVPACKECNNEKGGYMDYREFLSSEPKRLNKIEEHMHKHKYTPLKDQENFEQMQEVIKLAHEELNPLSKRYIKILNAMRVEKNIN
ncbi:HNH endonuclease [Candidatus Spongiihabitans sp.]|uniref:HNH endonuclease n=1 Tax=Candidatus Spongiihabitans sp. TaxID=3101308 RepID=UPI003C6EAA2B